MMKTNVTYVVSNINKSLAFEWISNGLSKDRFNLSFVLLNPDDSILENYIKSIGVPVKRITFKSKLDTFKAIFLLMVFFLKNKTQAVHCHLFEASLSGLIAAKLCGIKTRIYTRHHGDFHHKYFPRAVYYDKFINALATKIVSISKNVSTILIEKENVSPDKITLIHHGFDLHLFTNKNNDKLKVLYNAAGNSPVIGVIARYTHWKGIQYIIPAFQEILIEYPNARLILANASGDYKTEIQAMLKSLPSESYTEIVFEKQIELLYSLFDVYVHTPIDSEVEAFGQTYVEALATGVPSVFTLSGVANEFIVNEFNALVVDYKSSSQISVAVKRILTDIVLKNKLILNGSHSIQENFSLPLFIQHLEKLYA